jgi:hypothetical protein
LEIPEAKPVGFQFQAEFSSSIRDGYSDCDYNAPPVVAATQAALAETLSERQTLDLFDTVYLYIVESMSSYDSSSKPQRAPVYIKASLLKNVVDQSAEYHESRANYVAAIERLFEIIDSGDVAYYKVEGRKIIRYLQSCQSARGWDSTLSNSNYKEGKLHAVLSNFEGLAARKNANHPNYKYEQSKVRSELSKFGMYEHDAPVSWTTNPPRAIESH